MSGKLKAILALCVVGVLVLLAISGIYRVNEGEQALVLTFGQITDRRGPGLYFRIPGVQTVECISVTQIHSSEFGFRTTRQQMGAPTQYTDVDEEATMLTGDGNIVRVEAIYQWVVRDVQAFLYETEDPETTMDLAFESIIRRNIQNKSLDSALLNKQEIEREVLPDFQQLLDSYSMGVQVREVRIQNITVPPEVLSAYEDVNNARSEKSRKMDEAERYENQVLPEARSQSYRIVQEAEGYKAQVVAQAEGEVAGFQAVYKEYNTSKEITRKRLLIETMERILSNAKTKIIVDETSGALKLLPLDITGGEPAASQTQEVQP